MCEQGVFESIEMEICLKYCEPILGSKWIYLGSKIDIVDHRSGKYHGTIIKKGWFLITWPVKSLQISRSKWTDLGPKIYIFGHISPKMSILDHTYVYLDPKIGANYIAGAMSNVEGHKEQRKLPYRNPKRKQIFFLNSFLLTETGLWILFFFVCLCCLCYY